MTDWEEQERAHWVEVSDAYGKLIALVTKEFSDLEKRCPHLVALAKAFARPHCVVGMDDLYSHQPVNTLPVHNVDGKAYPSVSFSVKGFVPFWALYLPKAREALEMVEFVKETERSSA